jgi:hypothetical protein
MPGSTTTRRRRADGRRPEAREGLHADQHVAALEAEVARLRRALEAIRDLDIDMDHETFVGESSRIAMLALASEEQRGEGWQLEQVMKILELYQAGKLGTVTRADIDKIFEDLDDDPEVLKRVDSLADDAAAHPEKMGDMGELLEDDEKP